MADFDVELVNLDGNVIPSSIWTDDEDPTRLNPRGHIQHRYIRIPIAPLGDLTIEFRAIVAGVHAPADAALGGRLFSWSFGIWPPGAPIMPITSPVSSKTSRAQVTMRGRYPGHYVIVVARTGGGHIGFPFDVEAST